MKKLLLILLAVFTMLQDIDAQNPLKGKYRKFSIDISGGLPVINGDIKNKLAGYDVAARLNWNMTSAVSIGTEFGFGSVKGYESDNEFFTNRYLKALVGGEVYLFDIFKLNQLSNWFQPYVGASFGGLKSDIEDSQSSIHFNDWTWIQQFNGGLKFKLTNMIDLNASANFMFTGTDLLDNYNPNVNNNKNRDAMSTYRLGLTFHLGKKENKSIIWKESNSSFKADNIKEDSLELYTQYKLLELEEEIVSLNKQNRKLKTKVVTSEKDVDVLESKVDVVEKKTMEIEALMENGRSFEKKIETVIYFESGSKNVLSNELTKLNEIAQYLQTSKKSFVVLNGYTDKVGNFDANLDLSLQRAINVKKQLVKLGVSPSQIQTYGYGESDLLPRSDKGNRRVIAVIW